MPSLLYGSLCENFSTFLVPIWWNTKDTENVSWGFQQRKAEMDCTYLFLLCWNLITFNLLPNPKEFLLWHLFQSLLTDAFQIPFHTLQLYLQSSEEAFTFINTLKPLGYDADLIPFLIRHLLNLSTFLKATRQSWEDSKKDFCVVKSPRCKGK